MKPKKRYGYVGKYGAVRLCSWTRKSLVNEGVCYKEKFYGISCHRCLQMTPCKNFCDHKCVFCWRPTEFTEGTSMKSVEADNPEKIVKESLREQRRLISGYNGNPKTPKKKYEEAYNPNQVAISLAGEPTLYPKLGRLIKLFHERGMTTFLVTNGMNPEVLKNLEELPTQLYVTLVANNPKDYVKITNSSYGKKGFKRLMNTMRVLKDMDTRKVLRLTLVKDYNMNKVEKYAEIIKNSNVHFVEPKAYMYVGSSRKRLSMNNMPSYELVKDFSIKLAEELDWKIISEQKDSRVTLLAKKDYSWRKL